MIADSERGPMGNTSYSPAALAEAIARDFYGDQFDISSRGMEPVKPWLMIPEVGAAGLVRESGASGPEVRRFLTFACAVDYQLNSDILWGSAGRLYRTRPELFDPAVVAAMPPKQLHRELRDAGVAGRFHQRNAKSWQRIAERLASRDRSEVRRVIDEGVGCVEGLRRDLRQFPLLRGEKIGPMWIRIMANPGGARIAPVEAMAVGVDIHVRRLTRNLGLLGDAPGIAAMNTGDDSRDAEIRRIWHDAATQADIEGPPGIDRGAGAIDPALWFFGRYGCGHCEKLGSPVRFGRACRACRLCASS